MKNKFDSLREHVLVPLVLSLGSVFLVLSAYFFHEWEVARHTQDTRELLAYRFGEQEVIDRLGQAFISAAVYAGHHKTLAASCLGMVALVAGSIFLKNRPIHAVTIVTSLLLLLYIGFLR